MKKNSEIIVQNEGLDSSACINVENNSSSIIDESLQVLGNQLIKNTTKAIKDIYVSKKQIEVQAEVQKTFIKCDAKVAVAKMKHEEVMDQHRQTDQLMSNILANTTLANDKDTICSLMELIKSGAGINESQKK